MPCSAGPGRPRDIPLCNVPTVSIEAVVLQGEIDMLLDDSEVHLKVDDIVVQRVTNHAWSNRGTESCFIAFVLIYGVAKGRD